MEAYEVTAHVVIHYRCRPQISKKFLYFLYWRQFEMGNMWNILSSRGCCKDKLLTYLKKRFVRNQIFYWCNLDAPLKECCCEINQIK